MSQKDWGLALLVVLAWGVNFVVIRWGLNQLPPLLLGALRFSLVALPAVFFVKRPKLPLRWLISYAMTISFGQFALLFSAMYVGMPAGLASLVLQAQMFFTILFAGLFLNEAWRAHHLLSMLIAACGLGLLASQSGDTTMTVTGLALTLSAAACWGAGNIINRRISQRYSVPLLSLVVWSALIPPLPFLAMSWMLEGPTLIASSITDSGLQAWGSLLYLAAIATLFGYSAWGGLLTRYPAAQVAPLTLLVPVIGLFSARIILGETLNLIQGAGILLILAGLIIGVFGARLTRAKAST